MAGLEPGFLLSVTRLLPYKNVDVVTAAFARLPDQRLVVVGDGPERERLRASAPANVEFRTRLSDEELRWCYEQSAGLVAASHEDFGLTVLEAAAAGRPVAALRAGGYLETVRADTTGAGSPDGSVIDDPACGVLDGAPDRFTLRRSVPARAVTAVGPGEQDTQPQLTAHRLSLRSRPRPKRWSLRPPPGYPPP